MPQEFKRKFNQYLNSIYPSVGSSSIEVAGSLISPVVYKLPRKYFEGAQKIVSAFFKLKSNPAYQAHLSSASSEVSGFQPKNHSLFMSYDFHLTDEGLKLIEINTNAAFSMIAYELHRFHNIDPARSIYQHYTEDLKRDFVSECELALGRAPNHVAIVDEEPASQKMFIEFLMIQDLVRSWGWPCTIADAKEMKFTGQSLKTHAGEECDFIYNRSTHFYLETSEDLRRAYLSGQVCFSPNPREYFLQADKSRMLNFRDVELLRRCGLSGDEQNTILSCVPETIEFTKDNVEDLWANRKKYFFKPMRAHAGKGVFKGASMSHRLFDEIKTSPYVAQVNYPAPTIEIEVSPGKKEEFKYDIRFYAYQDQIQLITTRMFQGQVTNFRAPGSGFTAVELV